MKRIGKVMLMVFAVAVLCSFGYSGMAYGSVVSTEFGDVDLSFATPEEAARQVFSYVWHTEISVKDANGTDHVLPLNTVLHGADTAGIAALLAQQPDKPVSIAPYLTYNQEAVHGFLYGIRDGYVAPQDAKLTFDEATGTFTIVPEVVGNQYADNATERLINQLRTNPTADIDLVKIGAYVLPKVRATDADALREAYQAYTDVTLRYTMGEVEYKLDFPHYYSWLIPQYDANGALRKDAPFAVDEKKIEAYAWTIAEKYNSVDATRAFQTSTGKSVTYTKGAFRWKLNQEALEKSIKEHLLSRTSLDEELPFSQRGFQTGTNNFGNSYVEISIEDQHLWMYVNGKCVVDSSVVTGNLNTGSGTHKGVFRLQSKAKNVVLRGKNRDGSTYASPVTFWMPFDGGIGMHDASWRSKFGGTIYKTNGSHGCVNMPYKAAETVYQNITVSMPIIVW